MPHKGMPGEGRVTKPLLYTMPWSSGCLCQAVHPVSPADNTTENFCPDRAEPVRVWAVLARRHR